MIINTTEHFIELLAEDGMELYNQEMAIVTNRITAPLNSDLSGWIERQITQNTDTYED